MKMGEICTDNRFELIQKYKEKLIQGTNIETAKEEMDVIDNILFRFWQMGWLEALEKQIPTKTVEYSDIINCQQSEIEKLKDEVAKARRKALLEAFSKFAGHSDYHGDTILCILSCMAEGKVVGNATPLDSSKNQSQSR